MDPNMDPDMDRDGGLEGRVSTAAVPDPTVEDIPESQEIDFVTLGMFIIGMFLLIFCRDRFPSLLPWLYLTDS